MCHLALTVSAEHSPLRDPNPFILSSSFRTNAIGRNDATMKSFVSSGAVTDWLFALNSGWSLIHADCVY